MKNFQLIFMTLITLFSFHNVHAAKYDFEIDGIQYLITNTAYGKESVDIVGVNKETLPKDIVLNEYVKYLDIDFRVDKLIKETFSDCTNIESVIINIPLEETGESLFYNCTNLKSVKFHPNLKKINEYCFCRCFSLLEFEFPPNLQEIYYEAFAGAGFESITIPKSIYSIAYKAFSGCLNLKTVIFEEGCKVAEGFWGCPNLETIVIPKSVETIFFGDLDKLHTFVVPYHIKGVYLVSHSNLSEVIFENNDVLNSVYIESCKKLSKIDLSPLKSFTHIGAHAFSGCTSLEEIIFPERLSVIDFHAFSGCTALSNFNFPETLTIIGEDAFKDCNIETLVIPEGVRRFHYNTFPNLKSFTFPVAVFNDQPPVGHHGDDYYVFDGSWLFKCEKLTDIYVKLTEPKNNDFKNYTNYVDRGMGFTTEQYLTVTLHVPVGTLEKYRNCSESWGKFRNIVEDSTLSIEGQIRQNDNLQISVNGTQINISGIEPDSKVEIFDLYGRSVYSGYDTTIDLNSTGMLIVRINGQSAKVLLK